LTARHLEELADRYVASHQATAIRAVTLASDPTMLVALRVRHKPSEQGEEASCPPKLRLQWSQRSDEWPYPLQHKSVDDRSVFGRAWQYEVVDEVSAIDDVMAEPLGPVHVSARPYGDTVLGLARPTHQFDGGN